MQVNVEVFHSAFNAGFRYIGVMGGAEVESVEEALERAYRLTNTIQAPWWENEEVEQSESVVAAGGARSTSVDDYMLVTVEGREEWYRVAGFGFDRVQLDDDIQLLTTDEIAGHQVKEMKFRELRQMMS